MISLFYFGVGMLVLLLSSHALVRAAETVSKVARISPLVIGATVVALGTSLPELTVAIVASAQKDVGLAMGNIIGANIINILFVFPVGILIGKIRIGTTKTQRNAFLLLGATALFIVLQTLAVPRAVSGGILIFLALLFTVAEFTLGIRGRSYEDSKTFRKIKNGHFGPMRIIMIVLSVLGIVFGGITVVDSVEQISLITGLSTTILGLSMTSLATTLPELLTTIFAQEEHQEKLTIGNIIGSNIYNLMFVGGVASFFSTTGTVKPYEWVWLSVVILVFVTIIRRFKGEVIPKKVGYGLLGGFLLFMLFLYYLGR